MKITGILVVAGLIFPVWGHGASGGSARYFAQMEYWPAANAYKSIKDGDKRDVLTGWVNNGASETFAIATDRSTGWGVRAGVLFPGASGRVRWGGSLGYLRGPEAKIRNTMSRANPTSFFPVFTREERRAFSSSFLRLVGEGVMDRAYGDRFSARLRAGLGLARGELKRDADFTYLSSFGNSAGAASASKSWTGITYEVGPSLVWQRHSLGFEVGLLWMGLPRMSADASRGLDRFDWSPLGFRFAAEF